MDKDPVLTPSHTRWEEFIERINQGVICRGSTQIAREVLATFDGIDVERSLRALAELGGSCDCRIVHGLGEPVAA